MRSPRKKLKIAMEAFLGVQKQWHWNAVLWKFAELFHAQTATSQKKSKKKKQQNRTPSRFRLKPNGGLSKLSNPPNYHQMYLLMPWISHYYQAVHTPLLCGWGSGCVLKRSLGCSRQMWCPVTGRGHIAWHVLFLQLPLAPPLSALSVHWANLPPKKYCSGGSDMLA